MTMTSLIVSRLTTGYRHKAVLSDLSLAPFPAGTLTAILGPNAGGKSTLLRALAGLVQASGSVRLGDLELTRMGLAARARHVGFMPQSLPRTTELTVLEAVISAIKAIPAGSLTAATREVNRKAIATLERLAIADLAMERLDRLSGGQRQLASLAQSIVRDPALLLLDEPTSALDLRHQVDVMEVVSELTAEGRIVVAVLHDLNLAARWADRIVLLNHGSLHSQGNPEKVLTPQTLAEVYGVRARVERCSQGWLQIVVDGRHRENPASRPESSIQENTVS
ncbi:iron complex transport system ATP-binding protein [Mesorhizobium sp. YR577]|nr:iron complex transport system ATP-binding protein [Mesorhizobium sp. YR577]